MLNRLKIAMILSFNPSQAGGVQEHIRLLAKNLTQRGHQVDVYGPDNNIHQFVNYRVIADSIEVPIPNGNWAIITIKKNGVDFINQLKKYDIIHIHDPYVPFVAWKIIDEVPSVKIATFHSAWEKDSIISFIDPFLNLFEQSFSEKFSGAIFVSKIVKKKWSPLVGKKIISQVIHNGYDDDFFPKEKSFSSTVKLLFVGRLVRRKGPKYLLKAFNKVLKFYPKTVLKIVGMGKLFPSLKRYVKNNHLENNVVFTGQVLGKERVKIYQESDIFCAPYSDEAFGLTILEAMATGTPIVGFKNSAFREILKNYPYPKFLVKSKDVNQLAAALKKAIADKNKRKKISSWLINESKKYHWDDIAEKTEKFYLEVLRRRDKRKNC
jgi:phosphatidylinositol alpha-mannosyltransferase